MGTIDKAAAREVLKTELKHYHRVRWVQFQAPGAKKSKRALVDTVFDIIEFSNKLGIISEEEQDKALNWFNTYLPIDNYTQEGIDQIL